MNKLPNPKRVIVDTEVYYASHNKQPRGKGMWAFSNVRNPASVLNKEEVFFTSGSYAECKAQAQARFAYSIRIYVQP